jgi:pyruvate dehydrogenase E2 component (dihydrolipoamide acetyltransferase)
MVPVVQFADCLSLNELSAALKSIAGQCNDGSINPDLLSGGTLTLSNLGTFGIESFTPILNPPQVAILGLNTISPKPVLGANGEYTMVPHIGLSLTIDHRALDGAPAARFVKDLVGAIEGFELLLSL